MQPNVIGMGQFADGGVMASKPYAASANYINNMSNLLQGLRPQSQAPHRRKRLPFQLFLLGFSVAPL